MAYKITKDTNGELYLERPIYYDVHLKNNIFNNKVIYPVLEEDLESIKQAIEEYLTK
jgi:hypothetical protein